MPSEPSPAGSLTDGVSLIGPLLPVQLSFDTVHRTVVLLAQRFLGAAELLGDLGPGKATDSQIQQLGECILVTGTKPADEVGERGFFRHDRPPKEKASGERSGRGVSSESLHCHLPSSGA